MGRLEKIRSSQGFTLIELLIVVVIIGILAAIAIPQFASTRERAFDSAAKSDIRNAMTALEAYFADEQEYTADTEALPGYANSQNVTLTITLGDGGAHYSILASHGSSERDWCVDTDPTADAPGVIHDCSEAPAGG